MHGNSKKNPNPHHLYGIFEEKTGEVFKYGITDDPLGKDGLPARARKQVTIFNLAAGFIKFIARSNQGFHPRLTPRKTTPTPNSTIPTTAAVSTKPSSVPILATRLE